MMQERSLGATIRLARAAQGLDRKQLARLLEVAPSQVTRWENDQLTPSPRSLVALAQQLELPAADLFALAGVPIPTDLASLPAMLRAEYQLPSEAIAEIQAHIAAVAEKYRARNSPKRP